MKNVRFHAELQAAFGQYPRSSWREAETYSCSAILVLPTFRYGVRLDTLGDGVQKVARQMNHRLGLVEDRVSRVRKGHSGGGCNGNAVESGEKGNVLGKKEVKEERQRRSGVICDEEKERKERQRGCE